MTPRTFSDTDLGAYIDGELPVEERAELEQQLGADASLRTRLEGLRADNADLRAALDPALAEPIPERLLSVLESGGDRPDRQSWRRIAAMLAIFSLGLATGLAGGPLWRQIAGSDPVAVERAIDAHRLYVAESRHAVEVGADERDHLVGWLSKRIGYQLTAPDLTDAGFRLIGGRLLPSGGAAAAHFMYENGSGQRITLYVVNNPKGRETAFRLVAHDETRAFYWMDRNLGYALAGDINEDDLLALARSVHGQTTDARAGNS